MTLAEAMPNTPYKVESIITQDEELDSFLLTLGIFPGETITLVSMGKKSMTLVARDSRYTIDQNLASSIIIHS